VRRCVGRGAVSLALVAFVALLALSPRRARADEAIIGQPGEHPRRGIELEPHATLGVAGGPFDLHGVGGGLRLTFYAVQDGFIRSINNTVGFGLGIDLIGDHLRGGIVPLVMQWNFWLSHRWSVFGEPGAAITFGGQESVVPIVDVGGRFHFTDMIALTMRIGFPLSSVGISFWF
jgi:hypothetical protein